MLVNHLQQVYSWFLHVTLCIYCASVCVAKVDSHFPTQSHNVLYSLGFCCCTPSALCGNMTWTIKEAQHHARYITRAHCGLISAFLFQLMPLDYKRERWVRREVRHSVQCWSYLSDELRFAQVTGFDVLPGKVTGELNEVTVAPTALRVQSSVALESVARKMFRPPPGLAMRGIIH